MTNAPRGASLLAALWLLEACSRSAPSADSGAPTPAAIPVRIVATRGRTVERTIDIVGSLHADQEANLAAEVEGQVKEVHVDLGDRVEAGRVLARLDSEMLAVSRREAEARFQSARADAERARLLHEQGIVSPQEYDRLRSARDGARAALDLLSLRLDRAIIRAPIAGAVTERKIDVGDYARIGAPLFTIVADQTLRLRGEVSERFVPDLAVGLDLRGEVDAFPGLTVKGKVRRLNAALDPKNRSLAIEAEIDNAEGRLRPGFFVRASIVVQRGVATVSVPSRAIFTFAGVSHVYVESAGLARTREIQLGQHLEDEVEVLSGLKEGEPVIVTGLSRLYDGAPVQPSTESVEAHAS